MKKGFTLVEIIVVIAIIGVVSVLIATNFLGLIGSADEYEKKNLYNYLNEAACVYIDSKDRASKYDTCYNSKSNCSVDAKDLYSSGFIDENAGLLREYSKDDIEKYTIKVYWEDNEKKCCVVDGDCE